MVKQCPFQFMIYWYAMGLSILYQSWCKSNLGSSLILLRLVYGIWYIQLLTYKKKKKKKKDISNFSHGAQIQNRVEAKAAKDLFNILKEEGKKKKKSTLLKVFISKARSIFH